MKILFFLLKKDCFQKRFSIWDAMPLALSKSAMLNPDFCDINEEIVISMKKNRFHISFAIRGRPKIRPHKIAKNFLPSCLHWLNSPLSPFPCGHTINFERSEGFYTKKYGRPHLKTPSPFICKMSELDELPSPLIADVFYRWPQMHYQIASGLYKNVSHVTRIFCRPFNDNILIKKTTTVSLNKSYSQK